MACSPARPVQPLSPPAIGRSPTLAATMATGALEGAGRSPGPILAVSTVNGVPVTGEGSAADAIESQADRTAEHPMVTAVRTELAAVGRQDTTDGMALILAVQTLAAGGHTASGLASLLRAYGERRAAAFAGTAASDDAGSIALGQIFE